jgi:hypothetical protein
VVGRDQKRLSRLAESLSRQAADVKKGIGRIFEIPELLIFPAGFLALALGCRGYELTRGLTYTVVIFAAVTTALYYPQYFQVWGSFRLATLITPLIQVIMFGMGRLFRMDERDCRTMAIEVGMQNGGLASGLAREMGKIATVGLAPAIFGPLMNVSTSDYRHTPNNASDTADTPLERGFMIIRCFSVSLWIINYCCKTANPFGYEA